jgi:exonuclease III
MTQNVWFDGHNDKNRFEAIIGMILESNANIVCLQECTNKFLKMLVENKKILEKFRYFGFQEFQTFYGVVILSQWQPANIYEY